MALTRLIVLPRGGFRLSIWADVERVELFGAPQMAGRTAQSQIADRASQRFFFLLRRQTQTKLMPMPRGIVTREIIIIIIRSTMKARATNKRLPLSSVCIIAVATLVVLALPPSSAFVAPPSNIAPRPSSVSVAANDDEYQTRGNEASAQSNSDSSPIAMGQSFRFPNPLVELADMFSNFDDVVDDFFNKRVSTSILSLSNCIYFITSQVHVLSFSSYC